MIPPAPRVFELKRITPKAVFLCILITLLIMLLMMLLMMLTMSDVQAQQMQNSSPNTSRNNIPALKSGSQSTITIQGYVTESSDVQDKPGALIPVPNAHIYFISGKSVAAETISNAVGYYQASIPAGEYTVATTGSGFQTLINQETFTGTRTYDIGLTRVPFNGFVPYALYPVMETSPGRETECTIVVENYQVIDQMVTFSLPAPSDWQAWFPQGEAMMIRSGDHSQMTFSLKYVGKTPGPQVLKVVVNGGSYFAEVPIIVIVKDMPYEEVSFYSNAPERLAKAGSTTNFVLTAENSYAVGKDMQLLISDIPPGWNVDTDNGTEFYIPAGKTASTDLNVYIPKDTAPGNYTINATLNGSDTKPAGITLKVRVEGTPYYDAIIMNSNRTPEGYPEYNLSPGEPLTIPVRVYNSWKFPITIQANAEIGENWPYYLDGIPGGRIRIEPGKASEFYVKTAVPNSSYGNYTARVHLESTDQDLTLTGQIMVPSPTPKPESTATNTGWTGPAITGLTTGAILITLGASILRKLRK